MKYCIRNPYTSTLQIRNTQLRLIRYIRNWNLRHPERPILRTEIREFERIEYKRLNWFQIIWNKWVSYIGLEELRAK